MPEHPSSKPDLDIAGDLETLMFAYPQIGRGLERAKKEIDRLTARYDDLFALHTKALQVQAKLRAELAESDEALIDHAMKSRVPSEAGGSQSSHDFPPPWRGKRVYIIPVDLQNCSVAGLESLLMLNGITYWVDNPAPPRGGECKHDWSASRRGTHECLSGCGATMSAATGVVTLPVESPRGGEPECQCTDCDAEGWNPHSEKWCACSRGAAGKASHEPPDVLAYKLPCNVMLPPATTINAGCSLKTLMTALRQREAK